MKYLSIALLTMICLFARAQKDRVRPAKSFIMDSAAGPTLLQQCSRIVQGPAQGYWQPTKNDASVLEENLGKLSAMMRSNAKPISDFDFQYAGIVMKGKKYIYINAFHKGTEKDYIRSKIDLCKNPVVVCDGGDWFWGTFYDVEAKTFSWLAFNGEA